MTATIAALRLAPVLRDAEAYWSVAQRLNGRKHWPPPQLAPAEMERLATTAANPAVRRRAATTLASLPAGYDGEEIVG